MDKDSYNIIYFTPSSFGQRFGIILEKDELVSMQCYKDSDDSFHRKVLAQITHNNFLGVSMFSFSQKFN